MESCIFCQIAARKQPAHIIKETEDLIVFVSLEGHPLIAPKNHFTDLFDLNEKVASNIMPEAVRVSKAVRHLTNCDGINLVQSNGLAAGQDVFHFHLHIKPRWAGDSVLLNWDTRAIEDNKRKIFARDLSDILNC